LSTIRSHRKALVVVGALGLLLAATGSASAKTVSYTGEATNPQPGQSKGLSILMGFELIGKGCPTGPHCFDNARLRNPDAVSWAYPNCPEVLDSAFELHKTVRVGKEKPHKFSASGANFNYAEDHVEIGGRFLRNGKVAKGWFTVEDSGCSTGKVYWKAKPD
jgi:hypothetical protein